MPMPPRPTALMIPIVTVCRRPNGLPIASTTSPARAFSLSANVIAGRFFSSIFKRHVSAWIGSDFLGLVFSEVYPEAHHDFFCTRNDVVGSENVSVRTDNHAGA